MEKAPFQKSDSKSTWHPTTAPWAALGPAVGTPICVEIHLSSARLLLAGGNHGEEKNSQRNISGSVFARINQREIWGLFNMWEIDGDCRSFVILLTHLEPVFTGIFQFLFPIGVKNTNASTALGRTKWPHHTKLDWKEVLFPFKNCRSTPLGTNSVFSLQTPSEMAVFWQENG